MPQAFAETASCHAAAVSVLTAELPARPFAAVPSADGCTIYVSLLGKGEHAKGAIAVLKRDGDKLSALRAVTVDPAPLGLVLSHDGTLLIAASGDGAVVFDTVKLLSGDGEARIGRIRDGGTDAINVNLTDDDHYLFVSDEHSADISVIDLAKERAGNFENDEVIGHIDTGRAPIALVFSPDGKTLYTTSEIAPFADWPRGCKAETQRQSDDHPQGAILAIAVARAVSDPESAVLKRIPAGCSPVRLALSADGARLYVSARNDDTVEVFDTAKLLAGDDRARIATVPVGPSPVGIALVAGDKRLVVTNSARYASDRRENQSLSVIDTDKVASGAAAVVGSIPAGAFPRELTVTADGKTLLVTNFASNSIMLIDLARIP
jgi:YVTN family beta-propeller protein